MVQVLLLVAGLLHSVVIDGGAAADRLHVAPGGSDAAPCTSARPCASFDRAYRRARPGRTVEIAGGTYPPQTIGFDASKQRARSNVVLQPASGATVTIAGDLTVRGSHVTVRGKVGGSSLRLETLASRTTAANATANQSFIDLDGATFGIWGTRDVSIIRGDWGPGKEPANSENRITPDGGVLNSYPTRILLDGLLIHDQTSDDLVADHNGGLELVAGADITIRNTTFVRNAVYDIEVQDFTNAACCGKKYGNVRNVLLEGNRFGNPVFAPPYGSPGENDGQPEVQLDPQGGPWRNWTVRRNSFANGFGAAFDGRGSAYENFVVSGNLGGELTDCGGLRQGARWQANIWARGPCGDQDGRVPFGYLLDSGELRPSADAPAVRLVFDRIAKGLNPQQVAGQLVGSGLRAPGAWSSATVASLVNRRDYLGNRYGPRGAHPALVSSRDWKAAVRACRCR